MLKPRFPQSPPPPQSRVRIGAHVVDLSAREVFEETSGTRTRITSKAQAVIAELAVNPGQVLSRDDLMDRAWPGAFPTGDVLTQAITSLRKAFGDDAEAPRYIETISKSGYRLIAPVQWLPAETREPLMAVPVDTVPMQPEAATPAPLLAAPRPSRRMIWLIATTAIVLIGTIALYRVYLASPATGAEAGVQDKTPLVIVAGTGDDWSPRLSPDGTLVVFVSSERDDESSRLFLQAAMLATPSPLTHPTEGERDVLPVWSPNGRDIAFQRHSVRSGCKMMSIAVTGGTPKRLGDCPGTPLLFDWAPDASHLVIGGQFDPKTKAFAIHRLDLASGIWSPLDYPRAAGTMDLEPHYSPDGRWLAFRRNFSSSDLWRMPAGGGVPERMTQVSSDIRGFDWAPDSRHIVYSNVADGGVALFSLDTATWKVTALGIDEATFPDFALRGQSMVYEIQHGRLALNRFNLDDVTAEPERVLSSSGNELAGEISPDKHVVAFISDRSGKSGIWLAPVGTETGAGQKVEGLMPFTRFNPAWSPDSQRFLVIGFGEKGAGVYEVDRDSLRAAYLETPFAAPRFADYLKSGALIVGSSDGERHTMWLMTRSGNTLLPQTHMDVVTYARVDQSSDQIYFVRLGQEGLWRTDSSLRSAEKVFKNWPSIRGYKMWTFSDQRLWIVGSYKVKDESQWSLLGWPLARIGGEPDYVRALNEFEPISLGAFSPGWLILTEGYGNGRDIGMLRYAPQATDR